MRVVLISHMLWCTVVIGDPALFGSRLFLALEHCPVVTVVSPVRACAEVGLVRIDLAGHLMTDSPPWKKGVGVR